MSVLPPNPLAYKGQVAVPFILKDFPPTSAFNKFTVPTLWIDYVAMEAYILVSLDLGTAEWIKVGDVSGNVEGLNVDASTPPGTDPVLPDVSFNITLTGGQVASGTTPNVIQTNSLAANTLTVQIQRSTSSASTNSALNGVCHFDASHFSVDANGFVQLSGSGQAIDEINVDASTPPGTDPVLPNGSGQITVTGAQIAAATTVNVIQTNSLVANSYEIQIQRSKTEASTNVGSNGVCHFDASHFSVDANGFVQLSGGGQAIDEINVDASTPPGTDPVLPNGSGQITVTGGQVASATTANVIQTNSLAANTYTVQVQRSKTEASSTVGSNGVSHFSSTDFSVDTDGFVELASPPINAGVRFNAYLSSTVSNVTGDGTNFTVVFDTVVTNVGSAYDNTTGKFTAPSDGTYFFYCSLYANNIGAGHTSGNSQILVTELSGGALRGILTNVLSPAAVKDNADACHFQGSNIIDLLTGDTVECLLQVTTSTKTVGAFGGLTAFNEQQCYFSGYKIA